MIQFKNVRDVVQLDETPPAYLCTLDLKVGEGDWDTVEYCARENGGGICDNVLEVIKNGE